MRAGVGVRRVQAGAAAAAAGPDVPVGEVRRVRSAIHAQDAPRRDDAVEQSVVPRRVVLGLGLRVVVDVDGRPPRPLTDGVVHREVDGEDQPELHDPHEDEHEDRQEQRELDEVLALVGLVERPQTVHSALAFLFSTER